VETVHSAAAHAGLDARDQSLAVVAGSQPSCNALVKAHVIGEERKPLSVRTAAGAAVNELVDVNEHGNRDRGFAGTPRGRRSAPPATDSNLFARAPHAELHTR
jgi:hypothetical protein